MINLPPPTQRIKSKPNAGPSHRLDVQRLESLLVDLEHEHENLLELAGQQRDAIIRADTKDLGQVVEKTTQTLGRIAHIEQDRQKIIALPDGSIPTVHQIAAQLIEQNDQHLADSLTQRSKSLRTLMLKVNEEHKAVRQASEALSTHMNGLIKQVSAKLSHTGTYSRRGAVDPGKSQVVSSLDTVH